MQNTSMENTLPISKRSAISFKWIMKINNNMSSYRALAYIIYVFVVINQ